MFEINIGNLELEELAFLKERKVFNNFYKLVEVCGHVVRTYKQSFESRSPIEMMTTKFILLKN